jgi:hypothetical protein
MPDKWALKAIKDGYIKGSEILDLNDPFELLPNIRKLADRKFESYRKETLSKDYVLFCFSETYNSSLMWGHYGDNHRGVCLGFWINDISLFKVKYKNRRVKFTNTDISSENQKLKFLKKLITTKSSDWRYEREQRLMLPKHSLSQIKDKFYYGFKENEFELRFVYLGMRCSSKITKYQSLLKKYSYSDKVVVDSVEPALSTFSMNTYKRKKRD